VYLGKLTHEANAHSTPEGIIRDSDPLKPKARPRLKGRAKKTRLAGAGLRCGASGAISFSSWRMPKWKPTASVGSSSFSQPSRIVRLQRAQAGVDARRDASFQDWWRESRSQALKPRGQGEPSAKQRLEALKARIVAREAP
jgi:hypothetical protein